MTSTTGAEGSEKRKKKSKAVEEPGTTPDVQKPKKASKKKSVATNADSIHESQVEGKSDEVSEFPKTKKAKKAKAEAPEPPLINPASTGEAGADLTGTGNANGLSAALPDKAKSKKKKKSKPEQAAELSAHSVGKEGPAKVQKSVNSKKPYSDKPAPLSLPEQQSPKKKKKAEQRHMIEPEEPVAEQSENIASPAKKRKKGSATAKAADASVPSDAVATEEHVPAAQAIEVPAPAPAPEQEAVKKLKKKRKAAKELPADAAEQKSLASSEQPVTAAAVSEPETAEVDAPVSKKAKKRKAKQGEAAAEISQIDAEVQAKLAETLPVSETPSEPSKTSKKKGKKSEAPVDTGVSSVEESTKKKKKKRKLPPSDSLETAAVNAQVAKPTTISALPAASVEDIQDAALDGEAAGLLENELAKQMEAEAIVSPAETRKGTAAKAFQRVKADEWMNSKAARNNSYEANFGNQGWGAKAQEVLGQVRGKDFRHEKTKKKRGSYRGGAIDNAVNSFKFDSDED